MVKITGILLAAGASRRFGADKLTQRLPDGEWVALSACRNLLAGADQVIAVVSPGKQELRVRLEDAGARVVVFADAEQGMGSSLAFAVGNSPDAAGWLVALADMPWIAPATIRRVADALRAGALIAAPTWQGQRGHPVGFAHALQADLLALAGDNGAKALLQSHLKQLILLETDDAGILRDIDRPSDLLSPEPAAPLCF